MVMAVIVGGKNVKTSIFWCKPKSRHFRVLALPMYCCAISFLILLTEAQLMGRREKPHAQKNIEIY